ncbi:hypothetical protein SK128_013113, partial [Halocaridina rubra]
QSAAAAKKGTTTAAVQEEVASAATARDAGIGHELGISAGQGQPQLRVFWVATEVYANA